MKYKTLLFDADGTLLDFERAEYEALSDVLAEFGIPDTKENETASNEKKSRANLEMTLKSIIEPHIFKMLFTEYAPLWSEIPRLRSGY